MCGGDPDKASKRAEAREEQRRREVAQSTAAIDRTFAGRKPQYDAFLAALREQYGSEASRQKKIVDREAKFSLARGGLTGGSAAADMGRKIGEDYTQGVLRGEQLSQGKLADLISADESSRANLISLANQGTGIGSVTAGAARSLQANLQGARSTGLATDIGDVFGGVADVYRKQQEAAARRRGFSESEVYSDPFSRG